MSRVPRARSPQNLKIRSISVCPGFPPQKPQRKRGPKPDVENHQRVAALIRRYENDWILDDNLIRNLRGPGPTARARSQDLAVPSRRQVPYLEPRVQNYPTLVVKAIKDRLKAAGANAPGEAVGL